MCKIRLRNGKIPKNRSESWSTRCTLDASNCLQPLKTLKKGAYCFSFTSSVDPNSLHNSDLNQKKNQNFSANNSENLELFSYYSLTVKKHRSVMFSILSSWEHGQKQRRIISKFASNGMEIGNFQVMKGNPPIH